MSKRGFRRLLASPAIGVVAIGAAAIGVALTACTGATPTTTPTTLAVRPDPSTSEVALPPTIDVPILGDAAVVVSAEGILGWWDGANWVQAQGSAPLVGGESYEVHAIDRQPSTAVGSEPLPGCDLIEGSLRVILNPALRNGVVAGLAVSAPWDVAPHMVAATPPGPDDTAAAVALLADRGIEDPDPEHPQMLVVDLEGDGIPERFMVVERVTNRGLNPAPVGDYSIAFVRSGERQPVVLEEFIVEEQPEGSIQELSILRFQAFVDADGDGVDEIGLGVHFSEGSGVRLFDRVGEAEFSPVIASACGG